MVTSMLILFLPLCFGQKYLQETPPKLMIADFFGSRFPAGASENRLSVDGGVDERVPDMGDLEVANNLPAEQLVLHAGGRAVYDLPLDENSLYLMVKPGKKNPPPYHGNPFTDKANITLLAAPAAGGDPVQVQCGVPINDFSSYASDYCIMSIESIVGESSGSIVVTITVPLEETRDAVIWQLQLSSLDDSKRIQGTFEEDGRTLMRRTHEEAAYNTWLTMVSCVGKTGVGKSTLTSLLSGNDTMFIAHASSHGTTTLGADISTIIPSLDYRLRMEEVFGEGEFFKPSASRPIFLMDSEGMKFRGDEVDFITTGPVAIIANIIVWITEGRMRPPDVLEELRHYLKGLDRISLGEETSQGKDYGMFVVVLNKMQDSDQNYSDEQLCANLLAWGQSDKDDATIDELMTRFNEITCVGLPMVHLEDGEDFGYGVIQRYPRFTQGLTKLGNKLLLASENPRDVKVGNDLYQMNSTNAETIIGLLIDGANMGNIDLTDPCNVLYSINKEKVIQGLAKMDSELNEATYGKCDNSTMYCTHCVCEYRNSAVEYTRTRLSEAVINGISEAEILCEDPTVRDSIEQLTEKMIDPWHKINLCYGTLETSDTGNVCDISELQDKFNDDMAQDISFECNVLHMCGVASLHDSKLSLTTKKLFIAPGFQFDQESPSKATDGSDASTESGDGEDGAEGRQGKNINLKVLDSLLTASEHQISVTLHGGAGGNGGNGGNGRAAISGVNGGNGPNGDIGDNGIPGRAGRQYFPDHSGDARYCTEVLGWGASPSGAVVNYDRQGHCCCFFDASAEGYMGLLSSIEERVNPRCTHTYKHYQDYRLQMNPSTPCDAGQINGGDGTAGIAGGDGKNGVSGTDAASATKGGNGGKGGDGGEAGQWTLEGSVSLEVLLHRVAGSPGVGGLAGKGGAGAEGGIGGKGGQGGSGGRGGVGGAAGNCHAQKRDFTARKHWHESAGCHGFGGCHSSQHTVQDPCSNFAVGTASHGTVSKQGTPGKNGAPGQPGKPGSPGGNGTSASDAPDGIPGLPGAKAVSVLLHLEVQEENLFGY